jgi:hypothetical protein
MSKDHKLSAERSAATLFMTATPKLKSVINCMSLLRNTHWTLRCHKVKTGDTADGRELYFSETILLSGCALAFTVRLAVSLQKRDTLVSGPPPGNTG